MHLDFHSAMGVSLLHPPMQRGAMIPTSSISPSYLRLSFCKPQRLCLSRCSSTEGKMETTPPASDGNDASSVSWMHAEKGGDSYLGWTADGSRTSANDTLPDWIRVGGGIILSLGVCLGVYCAYQKTDASRCFSLLPPAVGRIIVSRKESQPVKLQQDLNEISAEESKSKTNGNDLQIEETKAEVQRQEESLPKTWGRIVVPAPSDQWQQQILAALQALKVIEAGTDPCSICTKREYARWLIMGNTVLSKRPSRKVFPAMYIEGVSKLAFNDVLPEDPDFPFIQGLAEAGLIPSKLDNGKDCMFSPDSPLTREDLITWKLALETRLVLSSPFDEKKLQEACGFIDINKVRQEAWPSLLADVNAGEQSIVALAFGFTRRFQPEKPVTKAQAAVALATGESWELVSEELSQIEAESIAEAAIAAELALEIKAQQEVAGGFNELLEVIETLKAELEKVKAETEEEKLALRKEQAALENERQSIIEMKHELEEQSLALSSMKLEAAFNREQTQKLRVEAEEENEKINKIRNELEVEKNALTLAREWAEQEAQRALAHSRLLEQVRKRWEVQGVKVIVHKDLHEMNIPGPNWHYSEVYQTKKSPLHGLLEMIKDLSQMLVGAVMKFARFIELCFQAIKQGTFELVKVHGWLHERNVKYKQVKQVTREKLEHIKQRVTELSNTFSEGASRTVDEWRNEWRRGAGKIYHKFKTS